MSQLALRFGVAIFVSLALILIIFTPNSYSYDSQPPKPPSPYSQKEINYIENLSGQISEEILQEFSRLHRQLYWESHYVGLPSQLEGYERFQKEKERIKEFIAEHPETFILIVKNMMSDRFEDLIAEAVFRDLEGENFPTCHTPQDFVKAWLKTQDLDKPNKPIGLKTISS